MWENISEAGVRVSVEGNTFSQLNLVNVDCRNVPVLVGYAQSGKKVAGKSKNVQSQGVYLRSGVSGFE